MSPSNAQVRITLTGAEFSVLAGILNSDKSADALVDFIRSAAPKVGVDHVPALLSEGMAMRSKVLAGIRTVRVAVVDNNQQEGIIDV